MKSATGFVKAVFQEMNPCLDLASHLYVPVIVRVIFAYASSLLSPHLFFVELKLSEIRIFHWLFACAMVVWIAWDVDVVCITRCVAVKLGVGVDVGVRVEVVVGDGKYLSANES